MGLVQSVPVVLHVFLHIYCSSRNILDDFREAYFWLRQNTPDHARVMSWWDYGYQIAGEPCIVTLFLHSFPLHNSFVPTLLLESFFVSRSL